MQVLASSSRGDGRQAIVQVELDGAPVIVKFYGRKRSWLRTNIRRFGLWLYAGKSGLSPSQRFRTELEILRLWREEGFGVPEVIAESPLPGLPFLVLEHVEGPSIADVLADPARPTSEQDACVERFARDLARRHERARALGDPRLVHASPTLRDVLFTDGGPVFLDFEIRYDGSHSLEQLLNRKLTGFIRSMARATPRFEELLEVFLDGYGKLEGLQSASRVTWMLGWVSSGSWRRNLQRRRAMQWTRTALRARARDQHGG